MINHKSFHLYSIIFTVSINYMIVSQWQVLKFLQAEGQPWPLSYWGLVTPICRDRLCACPANERQCNIIPHWLGAYTKLTLYMHLFCAESSPEPLTWLAVESFGIKSGTVWIKIQVFPFMKKRQQMASILYSPQSTKRHAHIHVWSHGIKLIAVLKFMTNI